MKEYEVTIPIAGHIFVNIMAENKADAIEKAERGEYVDEDMEWETLSRFNQGNVCYCPSPWEIEAEEC